MIEFQYEATGKTPDNTEVAKSDEISIPMDLDPGDPIDDGVVFSKALCFVMDDFYSSQFKSQGYSGVSEVTITIKNLRFE